jgi:hypothetical protein
MVENCCRTTDDGSTLCITSSDKTTKSVTPISKTMRGGVAFAIACIASPCCTPLVVPIILALLGGTPVALWLTQHIGWVYGGLTLVSVISLALGLYWIRQKSASHSGLRRSESTLPKVDELITQQIVRN